jgi:hypothetical protein
MTLHILRSQREMDVDDVIVGAMVSGTGVGAAIRR